MFILEGFVRILFWISNVGLVLTYIVAWKQNEIATGLQLPGGLALHVTMAVISIFVLLFANISALFYFIGTGRWIKDQAMLFMAQGRKQLSEQAWEIYEKANKLKALPMPFATFSLVLGLFTFIMGGAHQMHAIPSWLHPSLATLLLLMNCVSQWASYRSIRRNMPLLDSTSALLEPAPKPLTH